MDKWISQTENPHDPSVATYFAAQKEDPERLAGPADCEKGGHGADTNTKASVENSDGLSVSGMSSRASGASSSLRINAEAERLALLVRALKLKEKHAIEAQEETLRKNKETLNLDAEIEVATVKINYLRQAESDNRMPSVNMPVVGAEAAQATSDASQAHWQDYLLRLHDSTAPVVRTKTGGSVRFPSARYTSSRSHPYAQHSPHSYSSAIPLSFPSHMLAWIKPLGPL